MKTLHELRTLAENGDASPFLMICPDGPVLNCEWLDPYLGMFTVSGHDGFITVDQIPFAFTACCLQLQPAV